ncbi:U3 small nucleolar RNA-associated protein 15-like protein [Smittium culicis]|uniref:U3 small nucleolar RNA-associated protein 15-like protein n=2 Tax=Smittium culicis TaxID=133412 RepID=A0A1R1YK81_9FUNG|nr:U3 small nucleolar RNA-associated protein 15-like protein [Smittium culicis]
MDFKKIRALYSEESNKKVSPEEKEWKSFKSPVLVKEFGPVTSIDFSKKSPHFFAVAASTRVQIYSPQTTSSIRNISKFSNIVKACCFRSDGKLLATGDADGNVQVFDSKSKSCLRTFKGHSQGVNCVKFVADKSLVVSASDDLSVQIWEITGDQDTPLYKLEHHTDYIKTLAVSETNTHLIASGSYDHKINIYNLNSLNSENESTFVPQLVIDNGEPIEELLFFPGDMLIAAAGGPFVKVYDTVTGRPIACIGNFEKTVTSIAFNSDKTRILAASLDQFVKVYDLISYQLVASIKYPQPILKVGMSPDNSVLVVGMVSGLLSIKKRAGAAKKSGISKSDSTGLDSIRVGSVGVATESALKRIQNQKQNKYRNMRGTPLNSNFQVIEGPQDGDVVVKIGNKKNYRKSSPTLKAIDNLLRKFHYKEALDTIINSDLELSFKLTYIDELISRNALKSALSDRQDKEMQHITKFVTKNFAIATVGVNIMIELAEEIISIYLPNIGQHKSVSLMADDVLRKISAQLLSMNNVLELKGCVDLVVETSKLNFSS